MSFSIRKNTYRCFVCGEHGGTIDLVMRYLKKDFLEACEWLDPLLTSPRGGLKTHEIGEYSSPLGRSGGGLGGAPSFDASRYEKFFERPWLSPEARRFLFDERKLDPRVVRWCRLTSWKDRNGTPWLQIPYYDMEGKLIGVQNRNLGTTPSKSPQGGRPQSEQNSSPLGEAGRDGEANLLPQLGEAGRGPRFKFPAGSRCGIYNLPVLNMLKPGEELWITEGCSDCWSMLSSGHKAIAIPSATLLTKKDKEILSSSLTGEDRGGAVHMWPDADVPGERLFLQLKEVLPNLVRHQLPQGCKDFSELYLLKRNN